ncbi:MAG TPA: site-2 protease family protein [Chloroflexia bacterium]
MQASSSLRLGTIGPLNVRLHYTWLLAAVLGLWWLALLWLPDNYPGWPGAFYWLVSAAVLALFFLSVVAHELVHSATARSGRRTVFLFPFGAAQPFRLQEMEPARAVTSSLAGPVFNLVLGGLLLAAGGLIGDTVGIPGGIKGLTHALGLLNIAFGIINLIPGVPFDGGWVLASAITWFGMDSESALRVGSTRAGSRRLPWCCWVPGRASPPTGG